jgi:hypothetical protein
MKKNHKEPVVVMDGERFFEILKGALQNGT